MGDRTYSYILIYQNVAISKSFRGLQSLILFYDPIYHYNTHFKPHFEPIFIAAWGINRINAGFDIFPAHWTLTHYKTTFMHRQWQHTRSPCKATPSDNKSLLFSHLFNYAFPTVQSSPRDFNWKTKSKLGINYYRGSAGCGFFRVYFCCWCFLQFAQKMRKDKEVVHNNT